MFTKMAVKEHQCRLAPYQVKIAYLQQMWVQDAPKEPKHLQGNSGELEEPEDAARQVVQTGKQNPLL